MEKKLSKKIKQQICQLMLKGVEPINKEFLLNQIFNNHPTWELKKGVGIEEVFIKPNIYKQNAFYLKRIDGTITDISYLRCLYPTTKKYEVILACRNAIKSEINLFVNTKIVFGITKCEICKKILEKGLTHIDHNNPTFKEIFNNWISNKDINYLASKLNDSKKDLEEENYFIDSTIIEDFKSYHNLVCNLRPLCRKCNLSWERISNFVQTSSDKSN